jgi:2-polyprenyl-3-methyl-5-hydroxy-6-metoxy-1,4-benzoquinol methylase
MSCLFCRHTNYTLSYLPDTFFNGKRFRYIKCSNCNLIYLDPLPAQEDYSAMYPPEYQNGVDKTILKDKYQKLPGLRFSYGEQFDLIKKSCEGKTLLDYGCGNGNFIANAQEEGLVCSGAEFNSDQVKILSENFPGVNFYTISALLSNDLVKFDIIRLSNVLEHLDDPVSIIEKLSAKLNPGGLLLVEGPIETNFSVALLFRKSYFIFRKLANKGWTVSHPPTHLLFANRKNQRDFFTRIPKLQEVDFLIKEAGWPFPEKWSSASGAGGKIKFLIAKLSIVMSSVIRIWGNTFLYAGKKI